MVSNPDHWKEPFNDKGPKYDKIVEMINELNNPPVHPPADHASQHHSGGGDLLAHQSIPGSGSNTHSTIDTHLGAASPHSGHALTSADVKGTYEIWIPIFPNYATNMNYPGGTYGGGSDRYDIVTADFGQMIWDLSKYVPYQVAGNSVRIDQIYSYVYMGSGVTIQGTLVLYRRRTWDSNVNRTAFTVASDTTPSVKSGLCYQLFITPGHTMNNEQHYTFNLQNLDKGSSNLCRPMGNYIKYTVL